MGKKNTRSEKWKIKDGKARKINKKQKQSKKKKKKKEKERKL